jgi:hypothetical protein
MPTGNCGDHDDGPGVVGQVGLGRDGDALRARDCHTWPSVRRRCTVFIRRFNNISTAVYRLATA